MEEQSVSKQESTYSSIIESYTFGMFRFWGAEAAHARLNLSLIEYNSVSKVSLEGNPYKSALENLARIPYSSYDSLAYITNVSHLVYATTMLDTFLSDTNVFLFLLFPSSIGKKQQVNIGNILAASSMSQVITDAAVKRNREISFLPFFARIQYLRDAFGLGIPLDSTTTEALEHYPSIRNAVVHDQGYFEIYLDDAGSVCSRQKTCPRHPGGITDKDVGQAARAYASVVYEVAKSVMGHVLKLPENHPLLSPLKAFSTP